jgi:Tol biopolymer transport system component
VGTLNGKNMLFETLIGSGTHAVIPGGDSTFINDWTPDGKYLVLNAGRTVSLLAAPGSTAVSTGGGKPQTILDTRFDVDQLRVSPDGRWVAYMSTESGQPEVHVASFPAFTDRRQISVETGGAVQPLWRADGKELFFLSRLEDSSWPWT